MNFALKTHHQYGLEELENLIPWERETYIILLQDWLEKERERIQQQKPR